jgi:hypothetical protein
LTRTVAVAGSRFETVAIPVLSKCNVPCNTSYTEAPYFPLSKKRTDPDRTTNGCVAVLSPTISNVPVPPFTNETPPVNCVEIRSLAVFARNTNVPTPVELVTVPPVIPYAV